MTTQYAIRIETTDGDFILTWKPCVVQILTARLLASVVEYMIKKQ